MSVIMTFLIALKALTRNKMRTALTMLGMVIGVSAVITMVALGNGAQSAIDLTLSARSGRYALAGRIAPSLLLKGRLQRLTAPRVTVAGEADFIDRRLNGALALRSSALRLRARGVVDLGDNRFEGLRVDGTLVRPEALFANMSGRAIDLRLRLDGAFDRAAFDYRLAATRFAFGQTGFENAQAVGRGRLSGGG